MLLNSHFLSQLWKIWKWNKVCSERQTGWMKNSRTQHYAIRQLMWSGVITNWQPLERRSKHVGGILKVFGRWGGGGWNWIPKASLMMRARLKSIQSKKKKKKIIFFWRVASAAQTCQESDWSWNLCIYATHDFNTADLILPREDPDR